MKHVKTLAAVAILLFVFIGCQQQADDDALPAEQGDPLIQSVQAYKLESGMTINNTVQRAISSLKRRSIKVVENGWRAYPGPDGCPGCFQVHFVVTIGGDSEKYEFLVKDGGKLVEPLNEGTRVLMKPPPPPNASAKGPIAIKAPAKPEEKAPEEKAAETKTPEEKSPATK